MALALESLNLPFEEVFASEIDAPARALLERNFTIGRIFPDIKERLHSQRPKGLDLYCAGFPCQPYSSMGRRQGLSSEDGNVGLHVLMYIRHGLPKAFLLENVAQLGSAVRFRETFELIMNFLTGIRGSDGQPYYDLHYKILNSKDYGTPQNRNRIYIVGLRGSRHPFLWPETETMPRLSLMLDGAVKARLLIPSYN
jgi:DNA (cytosine-5)-methyltransferase 1